MVVRNNSQAQMEQGSPCTSWCRSTSSWRMADCCSCFAIAFFSNSFPLHSVMRRNVAILSSTPHSISLERNITGCVSEHKHETNLLSVWQPGRATIAASQSLQAVIPSTLAAQGRPYPYNSCRRCPMPAIESTILKSIA